MLSALGIVIAYFALFLASAFSQTALDSLKFMGNSNEVGKPILFLLVFFIIVIIGEVILAFIRLVVEIKLLGPADTLGGIIVSSFKFLLLATKILPSQR